MTGERIVIRTHPLNAETPLALHGDGAITPTPRHYVRSHFPFPKAPAGVSVGGLVERAQTFSVDEIRALPARTLAVTLECAGNGRAFLEPAVPGEQWALGAVSTARWTGASLRDVLAPTGAFEEAREVLFRGADRGTPDALGTEIAFERSLPLADALHEDVLVAYEMNGEPLPAEHGAPLRLVVPGQYGVASVKWLAEIELVAEPFDGFFQAQRYVIDGAPLGPMAPRSVIVSPPDGTSVAPGPLELHGFAWSGHGAIASVDVSIDDGATWKPAELDDPPSASSWRPWRFRTLAAGPELAVVSRASDAAGNTQPLSQAWNALGYRNNAAQAARVKVG